MFSKENYWANRQAGKRGQGEYLQPKLVEGSAKAELVNFQGQKIYVPRKERRKFIRSVRTGILKGRIDINELMKARMERDRKESGQGV